jgi:phosphoribosylformimino-5-aminoimidazole carboxamide ribotide isomerase
MLIPSIDLMNGQVVQLEQGERLAIASDDLDGWMARFAGYPIVQVIDLDAAKGQGHNDALVRRVCGELPCQIGGGIRSAERARALIEAGARRIILGSSLFSSNGVETALVQQLTEAFGRDAIVAAIDARAGTVVTHGWAQRSAVTPEAAMRGLEPFVGAFLYTDVEREGLLGGFDVAKAATLKRATSRRLIVAGGIRSRDEIDELDRLGIDSVVGMAIYRGLIRA